MRWEKPAAANLFHYDIVLSTKGNNSTLAHFILNIYKYIQNENSLDSSVLFKGDLQLKCPSSLFVVDNFLSVYFNSSHFMFSLSLSLRIPLRRQFLYGDVPCTGFC